MKKLGRLWVWIAIGLLLALGTTSITYGAMLPGSEPAARKQETVAVTEGITDRAMLPPPRTPAAEQVVATAAEPSLKEAFESAIAAANLAQRAASPEDWSAVAAAWGKAIQVLQSVPADDPQWLFAQRKTREYLANQAIAQQRAEQTGSPVVFPTLGNSVLDEQLGVYLSYVATFGPPDIMIIGSSRALQGINPQVLQQRLARRGLETLQVYNFAVNGATAQVVSFILQRLLTPSQLPRLILWPEGSRAFNSGRVDRTFVKILESPGYAALQAGEQPEIGWSNGAATANNAPAAPIPVTAINGYGFLEVNDVFDPVLYYQQFPRVLGVYDSSYQNFSLEGVQTVSFRAIADFAKRNEIPLVFVNLPLSSDYLDDTRLFYEQQFQEYLRAEAARGGFTVIDLLQSWPTQNQFFADPSHLNQAGANQIAVKLAENPSIPWNSLDTEASDAPDAATSGSPADAAEPAEGSPERPEE